MPETTHLVYSAAGAVAAAAAFIAWRLMRGYADPEERPADNSVFRKFGAHVRLRDLYRFAVMMEEEGTAFYLKMAELALDPAARKLCVSLADEETQHRAYFQDRLDRWRELPPNRMEWPVFLENVRKEGLFAAAPAGNATEDEMAAFAIRQERRTADFYRMFETAFPDAWKKEKLMDLVRQELAHEQKLRAAYPHLK